MAAVTEYTKSVTMNPFPFAVRVIITSDVNDSVIKRRRLVGQHERNDGIEALHCEDARGFGISYIFLPLTVDPGTIAHESDHAIKFMFRFVGADSEDEQSAYHLGHLVRAIHKLLHRAQQASAG